MGATFTKDSITIDGKTFPAEYNLAKTGEMLVFVILEELPNGRRKKQKIVIPPTSEAWKAARLAMEAAETDFFPVPETMPAEPEALQTPPEPASAPQSPESAKAEEVHTETENPPKKANTATRGGVVPEKTFTGQKILGPGWYIFFDPEEQRTRVIFERVPHEDVRRILKTRGFCWSPALMSWNKKLTWKAYRAALDLAEELQSVPAVKKQSGKKNPYYNPLAA